ncbi:MAG: DUF5717 family protein [Defluviitaleaceae bacterium]|nr:DUF5717 family protein [Defluviitaleaceae bacterium]
MEVETTYTRRYENPLPVLETDTDLLVIETKDRFDGQIKIKNTGGGVLSGRILSRCAGLTFEPWEWENNSQTINYTWNAAASGLSIGQRLDALFYITSNGGEKEIPVSAKLTKMSITTAEGHTVANIRDFYEYALTHPVQARRMFTDSEFYMLLLASGYPYMEVYESLHKDANRERAMDNFFVLSGLKGRTNLEVKTHQLEFSQKPEDRDMLYGNFLVQKSDHGYVEAPILLRDEAPWLTLSSGKLSAADFNEAHCATINFSIDPTQISKSYARELVIIGTDTASGGGNTVEIVYRRTPPLILRLNRAAYRYEDKGIIEVINNTGMNMQVEAFCPESYIRFTARSFPIGAYGEIPFEVKLSPFMSAQLFFRKLPYMKTAIEIKAKVPGQEHKKNLPITVGEW